MGVIATVLQLLKLPDGTVRVLVEGKQRARLDKVDEANGFVTATVEPVAEEAASGPQASALMRSVADQFENYAKLNKKLPAETPVQLREIEDAGKLADAVAANINVKVSDKQALLTETDPAKRLAAIHKKSVEAKAYAQALGPRISLDITNLIPGSVLAVALRAAAVTGLTESSVMTNTVVTNVPGANYQQYLCGAEMVAGVSMGPLLPNIGLFHIIYSAVQGKQGTITLSFTACREMMPDPAFYAECLQDSFDELCAALLSASERAALKPGKKPATKTKAKSKAKAKTKAKTKAKSRGKTKAASGTAARTKSQAAARAAKKARPSNKSASGAVKRAPTARKQRAGVKAKPKHAAQTES